MDNDDVGMCDDPFLIPVGEVDVRDDRDLTAAVSDEDIFVKISDMEATGNFFNSTTNFWACNRRLPKPADCPPPPPPPPGAEKLRGFIGDALMGAKNLDIRIENATVNGQISAAVATYREGLTQITKENCEELSNITQTPRSAGQQRRHRHRDGGRRVERHRPLLAHQAHHPGRRHCGGRLGKNADHDGGRREKGGGARRVYGNDPADHRVTKKR